MTDDFDSVMADIAEAAAANGGPSLSDVLRAIRASHETAVARDDVFEATLEAHREDTRARLGRIESHLESESERTKGYIDEAIRACRQERHGETAAAENLAKEILLRQGNRRVIVHWLSDSAKRLLVMLIALALVVVTVLLMLNKDDAAAQVTGMLALMTPFLLLLWRRSG